MPVDMLYRNRTLLQRCLSGRRLSTKTREGYRSALRSLSRIVRAPLEAGDPPVAPPEIA